MRKNGLPDCNRQGERGGADSDGTGRAEKQGRKCVLAAADHFGYLQRGRDIKSTFFVIIKFNFSNPVKAERSSGNKEGRMERGREERRREKRRE